MANETKTLLDGLCFPEGPRWHEGKLWFSDMHAHQVVRVGLDGRAENVVEVKEAPSGLGWLPDGRMLVVSMHDRKLLRRERDGRLVEHADLSKIADFHCNDMVVDRHGRAYVGNFGFDLIANAPQKTTKLALVQPDGRASVAATEVAFPNGCVITPDGRTLILAESMGAKLTAFDVAADGSLSNRRLFAQLEGAIPDGICLDAEGAVWVASPTGNECLRVHEGGRVSRRVQTSRLTYACMLGGPERKQLLICTSGTHDPAQCVAEKSGRIEVADVDVPGAGWP
jgi:sugar lactone lactonase YvrE